MIARIDIYGVPATLVAKAHVTLPGDEQVEVDLQLAASEVGDLALIMDVTAVSKAIEQRRLRGG